MFYKPKSLTLVTLLLIGLFLVACGGQSASEIAQQEEEPAQAQEVAGQEHEDKSEHDDEDEHDAEGQEHDDQSDEIAQTDLVALAPITLGQGEKLQVLATTSIIADLVANVGGDLLDLTVLVPLGSDPHTFSPTPQDVVAVANADVVFLNGLDYEEFLAELIENAGGETAIIALAMGVETRKFEEMEGSNHDEEENEEHDETGEEHEPDEDEPSHAHEGSDPHIWLTPANAIIMVHNIEHALSKLDPANAETYQANATAYMAQLEDLDAWAKNQIESIPAENRKMVTDHDAFGYYADRYGLTVVGAVIPAYSTSAEPSAQELAELQEVIEGQNVQAVFVGITANPVLSRQLAADSGLQVVPLYAETLGETGSGVETYLDLIRYNTTVIVEALRPKS